MNIKSILRRWSLCLIGKHDMVKFDNGYKRRCSGCDRQEWLSENRYPDVGELKYSWDDMAPPKLKDPK